MTAFISLFVETPDLVAECQPVGEQEMVQSCDKSKAKNRVGFPRFGDFVSAR
jgi:hypothetical protein